jgi:hypothetical protein
MTYTTRTVKLDESTPLPCAIYNAERNEPCGNPATVAYAYEETRPLPPNMIRWILQPVCAECAARTAAVYSEVQP